MPASLTGAAVADYNRLGYHFPIRAFAPDEAAGLLAKLQATEAKLGGKLAGRMNQKPHLLFPWSATW